MSAVPFYDLRQPTRWAAAPAAFSFSSLQAIRNCARRWQLTHSEWGELARFPARQLPSAIEGQIIHAAIELLARELGRSGRPPIGSPSFAQALERCGFWAFFSQQVEEWNARLSTHPRTGPRYVVRSSPRDLANQAVSLFRERYRPGPVSNGVTAVASRVQARDVPERLAPLELLRLRGALSELKLNHPTLPFTGVIDMVSLEGDGTVTIADFKTGERQAAHEEQLLLYALLWWRETGTLSARCVVQYLEASVEFVPSASGLIEAERALAVQIREAQKSLSEQPAIARPGDACSWCSVRPRCDEGWVRVAGKGRSASLDIQVTVGTTPTPTGFLAQLGNGDELPVVFSQAVGAGVPQLSVGESVRILDAMKPDNSDEVELKPWTEVYRM